MDLYFHAYRLNKDLHVYIRILHHEITDKAGISDVRRHLSGYNFSNQNIALKSKDFETNVRGYHYAMSHSDT